MNINKSCSKNLIKDFHADMQLIGYDIYEKVMGHTRV